MLIEAKASGTPLTHELRRMGIPVTAYTPSRGQDKIARMNSVAPIFESGMVWAPETVFADEVIEEKQEDGVYIGRSQHDAPEVDGSVIVYSRRNLSTGTYIDVRVTDTLEYDLVGEYNEHS